MLKLLFCLLISLSGFAQLHLTSSQGDRSPSKQPKAVTKPDSVHIIIHDTARIPAIMDEKSKSEGYLYVDDFGAVGKGGDDIDVFERACNYIIDHPEVATTLKVHSGGRYYNFSRPLLLRKIVNGNWVQVSINIEAEKETETAPDNEVAHWVCNFTHGMAIAIQKGKSVHIKNFVFHGQYFFPNSINMYNIGTVKYAAWNDGSVEDSRNALYCGVAIDPFCDSNMISGKRYRGLEKEYIPNTGRGGSTGINIEHCSFKNFGAGVTMSINGWTQNAEIIKIFDDAFDFVKICIVVCQDQSKSIAIERLKCWSSAYTVLDGNNYGAGTGGGSVYGYDWNIAGYVNQLINVNTSRFPISLVFVYSESLFKLGQASGSAGCNFISCEIDLLTHPGIPAPDYVFLGWADWYGGMLRYYDGDIYHRLNFTTTGFSRHGIEFRDMTINNPPLTVGLYGIPTNSWAEPTFDNVISFYSGHTIGNKDTTFQIWPSSSPKIDRIKWIGSISGAGLGAKAKIGDYLIGEPGAKTGTFYDNPGGYCPTRQIGEVQRISGDTLYFNNVGLNVYSNSEWGRIYISRIK